MFLLLVILTIYKISLALSCHHNVLPIFRSMNQIDIQKFSIATHAALLTTTIIYILIALVGYISFSGNASGNCSFYKIYFLIIIFVGNLLKDYCSTNLSTLIARLAFTITVLLTAPLQIYSSREAILTIIYKHYQSKCNVHFFVTTILITFCYLIAIFISEIELVMSFSVSYNLQF